MKIAFFICLNFTKVRKYLFNWFRLRPSLLPVFLLPFPLCEISRMFADHKQLLSYHSIKFPFLP